MHKLLLINAHKHSNLDEKETEKNIFLKQFIILDIQSF